MVATIKTTLSISKSLFDQSETLAQQLYISQEQLLEMALENFLRRYSQQLSFDLASQSVEAVLKSIEQAPKSLPTDKQTVINQGDIFWIRLDEPSAPELGYHPHPYVVVQDNLFNHSRIDSVVVCALTTNLKQTNAPGNVLLEEGEANLPKQSVVVVSKVSAVRKSQLGEYIGSLNEQRVRQILAGMRFLQASFFGR